MKTTAYISFVYGMIVILNGIMAYRFSNRILALFIDVFLGIIIVGNIFFILKEKNFFAVTRNFFKMCV